MVFYCSVLKHHNKTKGTRTGEEVLIPGFAGSNDLCHCVTGVCVCKKVGLTNIWCFLRVKSNLRVWVAAPTAGAL